MYLVILTVSTNVINDRLHVLSDPIASSEMLVFPCVWPVGKASGCLLTTVPLCVARVSEIVTVLVCLFFFLFFFCGITCHICSCALGCVFSMLSKERAATYGQFVSGEYGNIQMTTVQRKITGCAARATVVVLCWSCDVA